MANHSMLDPEERLLLLDALRPPEDYRLSFAIGTTYSLDLLALLTAPLGFTLFERRAHRATSWLRPTPSGCSVSSANTRTA